MCLRADCLPSLFLTLLGCIASFLLCLPFLSDTGDTEQLGRHQKVKFVMNGQISSVLHPQTTPTTFARKHITLPSVPGQDCGRWMYHRLSIMKCVWTAHISTQESEDTNSPICRRLATFLANINYKWWHCGSFPLHRAYQNDCSGTPRRRSWPPLQSLQPGARSRPFFLLQIVQVPIWCFSGVMLVYAGSQTIADDRCVQGLIEHASFPFILNVSALLLMM